MWFIFQLQNVYIAMHEYSHRANLHACGFRFLAHTTHLNASMREKERKRIRGRREGEVG